MTNIIVTAHSNIALVKYWGKADAIRNIPAVGSLSLTLDALTTKTKVGGGNGTYLLDGHPMQDSEKKRITELATFFKLDPQKINFESNNYFPTAAGLASSASGGAAAALALRELAKNEGNRTIEQTDFVNKVLQVSGSAPRSLVGGFARQDPTESGITLRTIDMPSNWDLRVLIITTTTGRKKHSSRLAMEQSKDSDYYQAWVSEHRKDLDNAERAITDSDFGRLCEVMELSTMKMHAVAMTTSPMILYWNNVTTDLLHNIQDLRETTDRPAGFTMDAGPHVKLFTQAKDADWWKTNLKQVHGVQDIVISEPGGPPQLSTSATAL